jgi:hypothetical protein
MIIIPFYMEDVTLNAEKDPVNEVLKFDQVTKNNKILLRFQKIMRSGRIFYINEDKTTPYYIDYLIGKKGASFMYEIKRVDGNNITHFFTKGTKLFFSGYLK